MGERVTAGGQAGRRTGGPSGAVGIIGPGRAGLGLALALARAGVRVAGVHGKRRKAVPGGVTLSVGALPPWIARVRVILLAVRDDALPGAVQDLLLSRTLGRRHIVLHLSGAQTTDVLAPLAERGVRVGSLHPLQTIGADPAGARARLTGATFAVDGDPAAVQAARALVRALGGIPVRVPARARAQYHAGAVFASNYVVAMLGAAEALLMAAGFTQPGARKALAPLAAGSLDGVRAAGPVAALTGPVARGDVRTIKRHLAALPAELRGVYREAGLVALRLAELGGMPWRTARLVRSALGTGRRLSAR